MDNNKELINGNLQANNGESHQGDQIKATSQTSLHRELEKTDKREKILSKIGTNIPEIEINPRIYSISLFEKDVRGENNQVKLTLNKITGAINLRVDPFEENKENYYYIIEGLSDDRIDEEVGYAKELLQTGSLNPNSLFNKKFYPKGEEFNADDWI